MKKEDVEKLLKDWRDCYGVSNDRDLANAMLIDYHKATQCCSNEHFDSIFEYVHDTVVMWINEGEDEQDDENEIKIKMLKIKLWKIIFDYLGIISSVVREIENY